MLFTTHRAAVNLAYPLVSRIYEELHNRTLLSVGVPPMVVPVTVEGLTPNSDGLYRLADLDARFLATMAEYEAIVDAPTS